MSKQEHTPGKWVIRGREIGVRDTSDTQSHGMMLTICEVDEWDFKDHWQANARLIAAAPEMLAAFQRILALSDVAMGDGDAAREIAAEMIAKARGEV